MVYLYRVMKPFEDPSYGLVADDPYAMYKVLEHVDKRHYSSHYEKDLKTQFISTCKTHDTVMDFAGKGKPYAARHGTTGKRKVVSIDVVKLIHRIPDCIFIDLTHPDVLEEHIPKRGHFLNLFHVTNTRPRNFARKFAEVLIQIPVLKQPPVKDSWGNLKEQPDILRKIPPDCLEEIDCV